MSSWISIEKRLPAIGECVQVAQDGRLVEAILVGRAGWFRGVNGEIFRRSRWQPLPPPKPTKQQLPFYFRENITGEHDIYHRDHGWIEYTRRGEGGAQEIVERLNECWKKDMGSTEETK